MPGTTPKRVRGPSGPPPDSDSFAVLALALAMAESLGPRRRARFVASLEAIGADWTRDGFAMLFGPPGEQVDVAPQCKEAGDRLIMPAARMLRQMFPGGR